METPKAVLINNDTIRIFLLKYEMDLDKWNEQWVGKLLHLKLQYPNNTTEELALVIKNTIDLLEKEDAKIPTYVPSVSF